MPGHVRARGKRRDGSTKWQARWRPADNPSDRAREERTFKTKREAERWIARRDSDVLRGAYAPARKGEALLSTVAGELRSVWTAKGLEPKTRAGYEAILDHWLVGKRDPLRPGRPCRFACLPVAAVSTAMVHEFVEELAAVRAPNTVRRIFGVLNATMKLAAQRGYIAVNPCDAVEMPSKKRAGVRRSHIYLEGPELRALADALPEHWRLPVYVAGTCGLRAGELWALRRRDVDVLVTGELQVVYALKPIESSHLDDSLKGLIVGLPKSRASRRRLALPADLKPMLKEHIERPGVRARGLGDAVARAVDGDRAELGWSDDAGDPDRLLFVTPRGYPVRHNRVYTRIFKPAVLATLPARCTGCAGMTSATRRRLSPWRRRAARCRWSRSGWATRTSPRPWTTTASACRPLTALLRMRSAPPSSQRPRPTTSWSFRPQVEVRASQIATHESRCGSHSKPVGFAEALLKCDVTIVTSPVAKSPPRPFPRRTLETALRVPRALRDHNGGQPWPPAEIAKSLNLGPKSGNFFYLTSAAKQYGLTEGTSQASEISLTDLGRRAVFPSSADEERTALRDAFLSVPAFRRVLEHYGGTNLPEKQYRENTLFTKFALDPAVQDEFVDILSKNSRFAGIGGDLKKSKPAPAPATPPASPEAAVETIAQPANADAETPVCFVIMPFVEHDEDRYPVGFFAEVLESLVTPAITAAGLEVRTAERQGSDLIHSTIINELLQADLVLADLTEHNPNVLFELGMRIAEDKPVVLVRAKGTGRIFDVDHVLRIVDYSPNLWPSTVAEDLPRLEAHIRAGWENRESIETYRGILTRRA